MQRFAKWHIWLGWLVGVPILMWTITGLVMVVRPIEEVRGEHLQAQAQPIDTSELIFPAGRLGPVLDATLADQPNGPVWIVTEPDGGRYRYSARTGSVVQPVIAKEAQLIAEATYTGDAELETIAYYPADLSPTDLRAPFPAWQAHFADGTNIYIRAATGEVIATRTGWWRLYDFMWGLHIMDLEAREDTSHPILILFAALGVTGSLLGCILLFRRRKARKNAKAPA